MGRNVEAALKSIGEIEAAVCEGLNRFEQEYMGRGPKDVHAHLIGDLLVVRLMTIRHAESDGAVRVTREVLVALLNDDLAREYQAVIS